MLNHEEERKRKRDSDRTHFYLVHDIFVADSGRVVLSSPRSVLVGKKWKNSLAIHRNRSRITPSVLRTFRNHLILITSPQLNLTFVLARTVIDSICVYL